ncbi:MAG: NADH-quinone oxidoreductase subunit L, partial [Coriobacteriia bacterium]|nr:NADH-quinone oxidoreductase subunit L [Coriobacteriia bacterium]
MGHLAYSWALPLIPLAVFAIVLVTGRGLPERAVSGLGIGAMTAVFVFSLGSLWQVAHGHAFQMDFEWLRVGQNAFTLGIQVDALTVVMLIVVSFVSLLVQVYSIGYMHGDERFRWFYGAIGLFSAAMLGVVLANNWLLMYACWEVMGLASYLLIGFWYQTAEAPPAAMKAFLVTRTGDVGFGLALVLIWANFGDFRFDRVFEAAETASPAVLAAIALLLFAGAMGKSAQFPLHAWLPDAMAGPTPGSALIHAATMVAAGVYLVARSFPLYEAVPWTLAVVGTVGTITAVMGALIALSMNDIKKVLAYSTISQLGYMFLALGTGNWVAAVFHLMTHAFFKALLFMGAGSVIHATETQDLHELGGLAKKMPWTTAAWVVGALSLAGIPPLAGFWSKDEILLSALTSGNWWFLGFGLLTALLTAFYMGRTTLLAFFVKPGKKSRASHAHESPWVMAGPLVALAVLAAT